MMIRYEYSTRIFNNDNFYVTALFDGTLSKAKAASELRNIQRIISHFPVHSKLKLASLQRKQKAIVNLLLDVHGHQILNNGLFNGDPHPGNFLMLSDGRLGLIDYGQCKVLEKDKRLTLIKLVKELGLSRVDNKAVEAAMYDFGYRFQNSNATAIQSLAEFVFDSDSCSRAAGYTNPQEYYQQLQQLNPCKNMPDEAVLVARTSFLIRGMGALLGVNVETSKSWSRIIIEHP